MQSGNHAPSFASDLPCPRSDIYSYSESYSYSYSDGVRWHLPAVHLPRKSRESVPGVLSRRPPGTVFLRECSRCHFLPSTWHGFPARVFQVALLVVHLPRYLCESVSGVSSRLPPGTETLRKRGRCHFSPSTWHGIPAKACQVSHPASHLARNPRKSVPGGISLSPTCHGIFAKAFQVASPCLPPGTESPRKRSRWHLPVFHLARFSHKSVSGVTSRLPPGTESPQKRSRCHFLPSTWHGILAKAFQVALLAFHLPRFPRKSVPGVLSAVHLARNSRKSVPGGISPLPTCHGNIVPS